MLIVALILVVALMFEARKPENWEWMWAGEKAAGQNENRSDPVP